MVAPTGPINVNDEGKKEDSNKKKKAGPWSCVRCSFVNSNPNTSSCTICGTPRAKLPDHAVYRPGATPLFQKSMLEEKEKENNKKMMASDKVGGMKMNDKGKKRSIAFADGNISSSSDDDDDELPSNKKTKVATLIPTITAVSLPIATKLVEPLVPTQDPCSPSYDLRPHANRKKSRKGNALVVDWVIYLAIKELANSSFGRCIEKCKSITGQTGSMADRLQLEGTRHVTLWSSSMTKQQASKVRYDPQSLPQLPLTIGFDDWIPNGAYLHLDTASIQKLKDFLVDLDGLPFGGSKIHCDHLSLYRLRGMNKSKFFKECIKIRCGVPAAEWGTVQGVSIRLKVMGTDYSHCRVLAGT